MMKIAVVTGSTRPGRSNLAVARWVSEFASRRTDARYELVDIGEYNLPLLDEPQPAGTGSPYAHEHTRRWSAKIASFDGYVFVTPEYNHGMSPALKNAIDYLGAEWSGKAAGFVSYGGAGGARAAEQLRLVMGSIGIADVSNQVLLSLFTDFEDFSTFRPDPRHEAELKNLLDQVVQWSGALQSLRSRT